MEEVRVARQNKLELEEFRKKDVGQRMVNSRHGGADKAEIERLQGIIAELQQRNLKSSKGSLSGSGAGEGGNFELEFKLHQAETRVASL